MASQAQVSSTNPDLPTRPTRPAAAADPLYPPQLGTPNAAVMDDAPPSYEDAMADQIAPTENSRPAYSGYD